MAFTSRIKSPSQTPAVSLPSKASTPSTDPLALEIQRLRAENEALKAKQSNAAAGVLTLKVSPNTGIICLYGLGQRPQSAYGLTKQGVFEGSQLHKLLMGFGGPSFADAKVYQASTAYKFVMANIDTIKAATAAANDRKASGTFSYEKAEADAL